MLRGQQHSNTRRGDTHTQVIHGEVSLRTKESLSKYSQILKSSMLIKHVLAQTLDKLILSYYILASLFVD